jgi:hypothetical protein
MTKFGKTIPALVIAASMIIGGANSAMALCNPGTKNCTKPESGRPKFCNPCTIDGGLGGTCKSPGGTGQCGIATGDTASTSGGAFRGRTQVSHRAFMNAGFTHSGPMRSGIMHSAQFHRH